MKEAKEQKIMLFGKNISLPENCRVLPAESCGNDEKSSGPDSNKFDDEQENNKDCLTGENHNALSESDENSETTPMNEDLATQEPLKNEKDQSDATDSEQKTLKKPDKILPCPRCKSMDTKFCYYNNYNVNQPRHFCKRCQRYWTAGGTMRNVPVGAGRRKNKNSSHCQQQQIVLQASQIDALNGYNLREFKSNGTVLSFGVDSPCWESMAPVADRDTSNKEKEMLLPCKAGENVDDCSSGSSITTSNSMRNGVQDQAQDPVIQTTNGFQLPIPCLPGVPWPYMWNPSAPMSAGSPSGFPMPFYPVPYWNYNVPGPWNTSWLSPTPTTHQDQSTSDVDPPILGKHSRDGELLKPNTPDQDKESSERSVLVPKTLRIDDPEEAAKSSIWATLGIKYDSDNKRRTMFNAFEPKYMNNNNTTSTMMQANPAALSRSFGFQETA